MGESLPAITGNQLIKLLQKDGWEKKGQNSHVVRMRKKVDNRTLTTVIQPINDSLADGTLSAILGQKQTAVGKEGLRILIDRYGLK